VNEVIPWASNFLKIVDISGKSWILSPRNARGTAGQIHQKRSARLPYVHHDVVTERGGSIAIGGSGGQNDQLA
jgi:hypothetical protein